jgi:hypothetical protein
VIAAVHLAIGASFQRDSGRTIMPEETYWVLAPRKRSDWDRLSPEQKLVLENGHYRSLDEAAKARLTLQLALKLELQIKEASLRVA